MHNDKRLTSNLLILLSFAILLFFTRPMYSDLQLRLSEKSNKQVKLQDLEAKKETLSEIQKNMSDSGSETRLEIARYINEFSEDELLTYFYSYADRTEGEFIVKSMTLNKKDVNKYGFKEGLVGLSVSAESERVVLDFLKDILSDNAEYRFFIEKFNMPEKQEGRNIEVFIPLKVFYK